MAQVIHVAATMLDLNPQYKTDEKGNRISVTIAIEEWYGILDDLQHLEVLRSLNKKEEEDSKPLPNEGPGPIFG